MLDFFTANNLEPETLKKALINTMTDLSLSPRAVALRIGVHWTTVGRFFDKPGGTKWENASLIYNFVAEHSENKKRKESE